MAKVLNKRIHGIPEGARYIGRPSRLGNPFVIGQDGTREQVIELYRRWIWQQMHDNPEMLRLVAELEGCDLVCWCAPASCHGDILIKASIWAAQQLRKQPAADYNQTTGWRRHHAQSATS